MSVFNNFTKYDINEIDFHCQSGLNKKEEA